jgi:hypothetical protein
MHKRKNGNFVATIRLTLVPGRDTDLIELIKNTPKGAIAATIREAMRNGLPKEEIWSEYEDNQNDDVDLSQYGMDM